jgi:hypothetical protein
MICEILSLFFPWRSKKAGSRESASKAVFFRKKIHNSMITAISLNLRQPAHTGILSDSPLAKMLFYQSWNF